MFELLAARARRDGGLTYRMSDATFPASGWAVSRPGHEVVLPAGTDLTAATLTDYVRRNLPEVANHCLGLWRAPEGAWYLDVTHVVESRNAAEQLGRQFNQRAIYCLDTGETVHLALDNSAVSG